MSQLNFYFTDEEISWHLNTIIETDKYLLFKGINFNTQNPLPISTKDDLGEWDELTIWVKNIYRSPICTEKGSELLNGKYLFDLYNDPIIQLTKCLKKGKFIYPGRVYYKAGWINNLELKMLHKKMAEKIIRILNKSLVPLSPPFKYSNGVRDLMHKGYSLVLGHGGKVICAADLRGA